MKVPVFFLPIFFVLLFANVNSFATSGFIIQYQSSSLHINSQAFKNIQTDFDLIYFKSLTQSKEYEILIFEEVEDQDSDESSSRKERFVDGFLSAFFNQYCFNCYHNLVKQSQFLWYNTSHRYILQGALRI